MAEDWREKLAKEFGREIPEEKEEKKDWNAAYEKAERRRSNRGDRRGGHGDGSGNQRGGSNYGGDRRGSNNYGGGHRGSGGGAPRPKTTEPASAPYNFVSLPEAIVPAPLDQGLGWHKMDETERLDRYRDYVCREGAKSGRIELSIETLTPMFIGGSGTDFFSPLGEPLLPGSTLRGFMKHMVRMISCGAMRPGAEFTERHLYSRGLADSLASFREYYKERMVETVTLKKAHAGFDFPVPGAERFLVTTKNVSKASAGFLVAVRGKYYVCPADKESMKIPRGEEQNRAAIRWHHKERSADVITGRSPQKKYIYFRIQNADWSKERRLSVPESVLKGYREDKSRGRFDLLANGLKRKEAAGFTHDAEIDFCAPCFYMAKDGVVQHFGHGRYYRIPYESSIADHVPESLQKDTIDFADAIFGYKALWAGRVSFEDAALEAPAKALAASRSHPLMTPNPTSFQLYLKQAGKEPRHWDSDAPIRGYKLYWHQKATADSWRLDPARDKEVKGTQEIRPLAAGARFSGAIRFKNLRPEELGALLEVFSLGTGGEDVCFKLGQGKSLGMGSVRIRARLLLEDTKKQFASLFDGGRWRESLEESTGEDCLAAFRRWRDEHLDDGRAAFETSMKELRCLLDWNKTKLPKWQEKTAMMRIGDKSDTRFKDRVILKSALDFAR